MRFKIYLTAGSILVIVLFFSIPFHHHWLYSNLLDPQRSIGKQFKHLDNEGRRVEKYGHSYIVYKDLVKTYLDDKIENPVVLLPPDGYLKKEKITDFAVVEPCIFYYFTGRKAVWYDSPDVEQANYALVPGEDHKVTLRLLTGKDDLHRLLAIYRTYKLDL